VLVISDTVPQAVLARRCGICGLVVHNGVNLNIRMARVVTAIVMGLVAGDWTATGWPAAMEGAVRGAHMAAESVAQ
jgi:hypothetical protein